ncbi:hypothetical protein S14_104 [Shewanella sp. phage 1/4]|nr:hypothetical protein S14_104 [Shewanella sp. phage 1/4]AHK11213.1 hypothetical protein S14_104 [Shewanella sp. phage 1/4]
MNDNFVVWFLEEDVSARLKQVNTELSKITIPPPKEIEDVPHGKLKENK